MLIPSQADVHKALQWFGGTADDVADLLYSLRIANLSTYLALKFPATFIQVGFDQIHVGAVTIYLDEPRWAYIVEYLRKYEA
jgi:hypothetical protein